MNSIHPEFILRDSWDFHKKKTGRKSSKGCLSWTEEIFNLEERLVFGHLQGKDKRNYGKTKFSIGSRNFSLRVINGTYFESNGNLLRYNDSTFKVSNSASYFDLGSIWIIAKLQFIYET